MAEAGDIPNLQQQREQEAEALRILDAVLKVGLAWLWFGVWVGMTVGISLLIVDLGQSLT